MKIPRAEEGTRALFESHGWRVESLLAIESLEGGIVSIAD